MPSKPRHLISMLELSNDELHSLVSRTLHFKAQFKSGKPAPESVSKALAGQTVSLVFNKRSTRTRISSEGAAVYFGGHPMFLGRDDIQLGVNESMYDTARVISSMTSCIFARVGPHSDIQELCQHSSVPIINSLCDTYHPLQAITDIASIKEAFGKTQGLKVAWIGDANNVINDLAIAGLRSGIDVAVCTPKGIKLDAHIVSGAAEVSKQTGAVLTLHHDPLEAVKNADILVTDTWVSMGQEEEAKQKLKQFSGFQISQKMATDGGANPGWKFMHCLPRHQEEVHDNVFYDESRSIVFAEAENRLYAAMAAIEGFVVNKGDLLK
ncbi:hypothetical protein BABINDRAFT_5776 [Babjeviella inositovora NRRL Y-12698]|uniref:ornithine carbamoyltransferase n=1 Tax=Babjeviella inositovora NRRL Y-12698 TaxID=984486 RepID=A0A1E3QZ88_9ASCO|nr:uncharacterized protein BABINDRAFT_5776 [Babjeviella inositovora NRRL Y-12698]ODQ82874.1 hypothetical protein BABINDRAFT_5776 [Babjeviella inositovora NRRL Y-12698]